MKKELLIQRDHTLVMGIVNVTDDSFSGDGNMSLRQAIKHAQQLIADGAEILDIGGESSRPGAISIDENEEVRRIIPVIEHFANVKDICISVDTYKPFVAEQALKAGAHIINDITGLENIEMAKLIAKYGSKVVIMHMQGTPKTMQENPKYKDVILEIEEFFKERIHRAISAGIPKENIILDPGIGFGKTLEHNILILKNISYFVDEFEQPILIGTSRKSFIGSLTGKIEPCDRVWGTAATVSAAVLAGASIVRVHDVKEMKDVVIVTDALR